MKRAPSEDTAQLKTERRNPATDLLDTWPSIEMARAINAEDARIAGAVKKALPQIARAIDAIAAALSDGGRLIYVGTGTSGRLAALDAAECPPTFNTDPKMVQYVIAGGVKALGRAVEANEDSRQAGRADLAKRKPTNHDVVVGITASGRTPYTVAAVAFARSCGAVTVGITCNPHSPLEKAVDIPIVVEVGPEVVAGSTRMKAGTSQKMVLNMISTGAMARLGYVFGNLMVNLRQKNSKLLERAIRILQQAAGLDHENSLKALNKAGGNVAVAIIMTRRKASRTEAERLLQKSRKHIRAALGEV
ncbi:MAG: N-acetylmuramic acid 6-phosphate etherase [Acidobacteriota bacterium]|nr:N-acetylmuramic acid 6-phosphate etherase [Acidobacteriota bacterium]